MGWGKIMNLAILWDTAPYNLYVNRCFRGTYHLHLQSRKSVQLIFDPEDGGDTFLQNVGSRTDYTRVPFPMRSMDFFFQFTKSFEWHYDHSTPKKYEYHES
jgi:hypothetical protein